MSDYRPRSELLERTLSASAALVAVSALCVSMYQTKIMREQQKMSAWPYVTQGNTGSDTSYARLVMNVGLGPAVVRSMTITVDGRNAHAWSDLLRAGLRVDSAQLRSRFLGSRMTTSSVRHGMVLLPGNATELIRIGGPFGGTLRGVLNNSRVHIRVCYCSVYGDCWLTDSRESEAAEVRECAYDPATEFES